MDEEIQTSTATQPSDSRFPSESPRLSTPEAAQNPDKYMKTSAKPPQEGWRIHPRRSTSMDIDNFTTAHIPTYSNAPKPLGKKTLALTPLLRRS